MKRSNLILWTIYTLLDMICTFFMQIFFHLHKISVEFWEAKGSLFYFIRMNEPVSYLKSATYGVCNLFRQYQTLSL